MNPSLSQLIINQPTPKQGNSMKDSSILKHIYDANIELQDKFLKNVSKCGLKHNANLFCYSLKSTNGEKFEESGDKERIAWCKLEYPEVRDDETGEVLAPRLFRCFSKKGDFLFDSKEGCLHTLDEIRERVYSYPVVRVQN